jgi:hypothetical protein
MTSATPETVDEKTDEIIDVTPEPEGEGVTGEASPGPVPPTRAVIGTRADLQTSGQLPALATMSNDDFEVTLQGMKITRERLARVHREVMQHEVDYGRIPGTQKDTLYKSGAEILFKMNRCVMRFERYRTIEKIDGHPDHISWDSICYAIDAEGNVQAEGSGSCNSWEKKYRYRSGERVCPSCEVPAIIKGQEKYGGGWICWKKKNGCGAKFDDGDVAITSQEVGQIENPDPWELDNTLKKMADKRAMVASALSLQAASGSFTQDIGDPDADEQPPDPRPQQPERQEPLAEKKGRKATEKQKKMLRAVSYEKAEKLMDFAAEHDLPLKHQDHDSLAASIRKHAAIAVGVGDDVYANEVDQLKDAINTAEIDEKGEVMIPQTGF